MPCIVGLSLGMMKCLHVELMLHAVSLHMCIDELTLHTAKHGSVFSAVQGEGFGVSFFFFLSHFT